MNVVRGELMDVRRVPVSRGCTMAGAEEEDEGERVNMTVVVVVAQELVRKLQR